MTLKPTTMWEEIEPLLREEIEPLPGSIIPQFIRCGKPSCRCLYGQGHGPYFYRVWREDGQVRKAYVKITEVEMVQRQTDLYRALETELRRLSVLRRTISVRYAKARARRRLLVIAWANTLPELPKK